MTLPVVDKRLADIQQRLTSCRNELALAYLRRSMLMHEQSRYLTQRDIAVRWGITQPRVASAVAKARRIEADMMQNPNSPAVEQRLALQYFGHH